MGAVESSSRATPCNPTLFSGASLPSAQSSQQYHLKMKVTAPHKSPHEDFLLDLPNSPTLESLAAVLHLSSQDVCDPLRTTSPTATTCSSSIHDVDATVKSTRVLSTPRPSAADSSSSSPSASQTARKSQIPFLIHVEFVVIMTALALSMESFLTFRLPLSV